MLASLQPGTMIPNEQMLALINHEYDQEILDASDTEKKYVQRVNWNLYINNSQLFTSEEEFLHAGLLGILHPELVLEFPTFKDIFRIKTKRFKTNISKLNFIRECADSLKHLPRNSAQLANLIAFLKKKMAFY